jgi:hypothetical protein
LRQGFYGECGLRGGYFEVFNIPHDVKAELYKLCSISLCSNTVGQVRASQVLRGVFCGCACDFCCIWVSMEARCVWLAVSGYRQGRHTHGNPTISVSNNVVGRISL